MQVHRMLYALLLLFIQFCHCVVCPPGSYSTDELSSTCISCVAGKYSTALGATYTAVLKDVAVSRIPYIYNSWDAFYYTGFYVSSGSAHVMVSQGSLVHFYGTVHDTQLQIFSKISRSYTFIYWGNGFTFNDLIHTSNDLINSEVYTVGVFRQGLVDVTWDTTNVPCGTYYMAYQDNVNQATTPVLSIFVASPTPSLIVFKDDHDSFSMLEACIGDTLIIHARLIYYIPIQDQYVACTSLNDFYGPYTVIASGPSVSLISG